jgi:hypothetical protein
MTKRILPFLVLAGCAHSGMSASVRQDITARMESAKPTITDCYAKELKIDRKLRGTVDLSFETTPKTGDFDKVTVTRDDMKDPQLEQCVVTAVDGLKLAQPVKSKIAVTYPLDFAPTK